MHRSWDTISEESPTPQETHDKNGFRNPSAYTFNHVNAEEMLIALIGLPAAGKKTIADYLCVHHAFELVKVDPQAHQINGEHQYSAEHSRSPKAFRSPAALLEYATSNWRSQLVTLDLTTVPDLEVGFDKRPWFLLVWVEAPLSVRWSRSQRCACAGVRDSGSL